MKKWYSIGLLVIALVLASAFVVACGDEEVTTDDVVVDDATDDAADDAADAADDAADDVMMYDWGEAKDHLGETATVVGPVVSVNLLTFADNKVLVNIGEETEDGFCVAIEGYDTDKFEGLDDSMVGKTVTVTGEIYENEFDHWAEIAISDPSEWEVTGYGADDASSSGVDVNTIGLYFEDMGDNVIMIIDVPAPGMQFPIDTSPTNDFASTVEVLDADGNSLGMLETLTDDTGASTGEVDYSEYADTAAKLIITTFDGTEHEYELGM